MKLSKRQNTFKVTGNTFEKICWKSICAVDKASVSCVNKKQPPQKSIFKNFAKSTGKHLYRSLFSIKLQALGYNFIEKETPAPEFSC